MKRHPALPSLSHDHHHALVQPRRLRRAAAADGDPAPSAASFRRFFAAVTVPHVREEEEVLFPLVVDAEEARPLVVEALVDHQNLHALAASLDGPDDNLRASMDELGRRLEQHVRLEERSLFPLIERLVPTELGGLEGAQKPQSGPVWGLASDDLNATLLAWNAGEDSPEHVNDERDVLIFVAEGSATIAVDGDERELANGEALIVGKGRRRKITAGPGGVCYLSAHLRRGPLEIQSSAKRGA
jgi:mannose-6-phosphate isomerase-like protein (cupin superfamily)